jgi:hypothetical protein
MGYYNYKYNKLGHSMSSSLELNPDILRQLSYYHLPLLFLLPMFSSCPPSLLLTEQTMGARNRAGIMVGEPAGESIPVPEIIDPVFAKTSQNARFLLSSISGLQVLSSGLH